jgi:hypothetical protein
VFCVATTALFTVSLKLAVAVAPFVSVAATVYVVAARVIVGVPVIAPLLVEMLSPAGSDGEMLYVSVPVPPVPVTGVNNAARWLSVRIFDAMDCVATTVLFTDRLKLAVAVAPLMSVTVTVNVVDALIAVGVPIIAPLVEERVSPAGSAGEMLYVRAPVPPTPVTGVNDAA